MKLPFEIYDKIMNYSVETIIIKLIIDNVLSFKDLNKITIDENIFVNLIKYSIKNKVVIAEKLFLSDIDPNISIDCFSILSLASYYGLTNLVKILVNKGADLFYHDNEPIKFAALNNHVDLLNYLKPMYQSDPKNGLYINEPKLFHRDEYLENLHMENDLDNNFRSTETINELFFSRLLVAGLFE